MKKIIKSCIPSILFLVYVLVYKYILFPIDFVMPFRSMVAIFFTVPIAILYFIWTPLMINFGFVQDGGGWGANLLDIRAQALITVFYMILLYLVIFGIHSMLEKRKKAHISPVSQEFQKK